jgi:hypothetical protein
LFLKNSIFNFKSFSKYLLAIIFIGFALQANAQKKTRILFLIDASSSMSYNWNGNDNRFQAAARVVLGIVDSIYAINNEVEFGVRVYGADYPSQEKNCVDTKLEVPFNLQNTSQIKNRLKYITPRGSSPIAYSLQQAAENELSNTDIYDYSFVLITDGGESCGGDICDVYKKIVSNKIKISPYIIGLDSNSNMLKYYECIGQYVGVKGPKDIATAVELVVNNNRKIIDKPKLLNIPIQFSNSTPLEKPAPKPFEAIMETLNILPSIRHKINIDYAKTYTVLRIKGVFPKLYIPVYVPEEMPKQLLEALKLITLKSFKTGEPKIFTLKKYKQNKLPALPTEMIYIPEMEVTTLIAMARNLKLNLLPIKSNTKTGKIFKLGKSFLPEELKYVPELEANILSPLVNPFKLNLITVNVKSKTPKNFKLGKSFLPEELKYIPEMEGLKLDPLPSVLAKRYARNLPIKSMFAKKYYVSKSKFPAEMIEAEAIPAEVLKEIYSIPFRMNYMYGSSYSGKPARRKVTKPFVPEYMVPKPKAVEAPIPADKKPTEFKVINEPSETTQVTVYFTDGLGKFYKTKPMVEILESGTQNVVKKFMRDILPGTSEPEPVDINFDGTYDFTVLGLEDVVVKNVKLVKNQNNKVIIKVTNGTIIITYQNNRTRPVMHKVNVYRRFGDRHVSPVSMLGTEQKMFEPGDYYVELDILPSYSVATEVSFGATTEIQIPQEGLLNITNLNAIGEVTLMYEHGDQYEAFKVLQINGTDIEGQKLYLRPGLFRAVFKDPKSAPNFPRDVVLPFQIRANTETLVELRDTKGLVVTPDGTGKPIYINEAPKINVISTPKGK